MSTFPAIARLPDWHFRTALIALTAFALLAVAAIIAAQVGGERGIAPVAASNDIEVTGIDVDTRGDTPEEAREAGWREAQRKAWERIDGPAISDSQLESLVSAVVIERERLGPRRYIATLGVIFDRQRAGRLIGEGGAAARSAPMLLIPVTLSGGTATSMELRNEWQRAWAEFQAGGSRIDYVRPSGFGEQSLLINYGQTNRRSRYWWRNILDQFGASDVLMAFARLDYQFPGGPVRGTFTARYGPDNRYLGSFSMNAANSEELPDMLDQAVRRFDRLYTGALNRDILQPDPTLTLDQGQADAEIQRLIELGRRLRAADVARERATAEPQPSAEAEPAAPPPSAQPTQAAMNSITVQFATPDPSAFDATLSGVRSVNGVRSTAITSTAIGGTSVMRVGYAGSIDELAAALAARGFTVQQGASAIAISR